MFQCSLEAIFAAESLVQCPGNFETGAGDLPAGLAHEVQVRAVDAQELEAALSVFQVDARDQVELLEQIEGPVYRGDVHRRTDLLDEAVDLFRRGQAFDFVEDG